MLMFLSMCVVCILFHACLHVCGNICEGAWEWHHVTFQSLSTSCIEVETCDEADAHHLA